MPGLAAAYPGESDWGSNTGEEYLARVQFIPWVRPWLRGRAKAYPAFVGASNPMVR